MVKEGVMCRSSEKGASYGTSRPNAPSHDKNFHGDLSLGARHRCFCEGVEGSLSRVRTGQV